MQYIGGKQKSGGQHIAAIVKRFARESETTRVVEPFCGGLSVTYRLRGYDVEASDACAPLITLYRAMVDGWDPPATVDRKTWEKYRDAPDPSDPLTAFVGFGCSRSGAWFSSYVERFKRTGDNYVPAATAARDSLRRKLGHCTGVAFAARSYADAPVRDVVYCDPPYADSLGYPAVGAFDSAAFWAWAEDVSARVPVLVSERAAPEGWAVVQEWSLLSRIVTKTNTRRVERVFVHERWSDVSRVVVREHGTP